MKINTVNRTFTKLDIIDKCWEKRQSKFYYKFIKNWFLHILMMPNNCSL